MIDYNRLISEISDESAFVLLGNNRVRSLQKLSEILPTIPDSSFYEHVNDSKNDFSSWIKHCFNDELLAEKVSKLRTKQEVSDAIISRLSQAKEALRLKQEQVLPDKIEQSQIKDEPTIIAKTQKVDNSTNDALSVNQVNDITIPDISQTNNTVQELKTTQLNDEKVNIENKSAELNQLEPLNNAQDLTLDDNLDANLDTDLETPNPKIKDTNITGEKLGLKVNDTQTNNTTDIKLENNSDTSLDASLDNALDSNLDSSLDSDLGVPINLTSSVTTQEIKENDSLKDKDKILEKLSPIIENSKIEEIKIEPVIKIETIIEKPPIVEVKEETVKPVIVEQPSQVNMLSEDNKLTDEEKLLLITDNKNLSPKQIFKKIKLQKTISSSQLNKSAEVKISKDIYETTKSKELSAQENSVSAVDILNISDEEFQSLLGINSNDKYIATLSDSSSIKQKKRRHLKTGVEGFDDLIDKGILEGSSVLVSGGPGSGKTTFCIQQLGWAAEHGEKCLFISLEEKEENLIDHMKGYGLNPEKYIKDETLKIKKLDSFKLSRSVEALLAHARGELMIDIAPVLDIIPDNYKPDRVVLDSLSSIAAAFAGRPEEYRIYVEQLFNIFGKLGVTSFIITEIQGSESSGHGGVEDFLADGVINFYNMKKGTIRQSAVEVLKMRGVNHKKKIVPFGFISGKGLEVYPLEEVFHGD